MNRLKELELITKDENVSNDERVKAIREAAKIKGINLSGQSDEVLIHKLQSYIKRTTGQLKWPGVHIK